MKDEKEEPSREELLRWMGLTEQDKETVKWVGRTIHIIDTPYARRIWSTRALDLYDKVKGCIVRK